MFKHLVKFTFFFVCSISLGWAQILTSSFNQNSSRMNKRYNLGVSTTFASNFYALSDQVNNSLTNVTGAYASYRFADQTTLTGSLSLAKDLRGQREQSFNDGSLTASKKLFQINPNLSLSGATSLFIPLSQTSRVSQSLKYAVQFAPTVNYSANHLVRGLSFLYRPAVRFNFHEYTTQSDGTSNTKYRLRNQLMVYYYLSDSFYLNLDNSYIRMWRYSGQTADTFSFDQSLNYSFNQNFTLSVGHSLGGSALALNGRDSNVRLFDQNQSTYYLSLAYRY